jgi:SAM-dependent methyltransferase
MALKAKQQSMWASADFALIGSTLQIVGETLCEAADVQAGSRVLDVACGNGTAALAAARRFCAVTGVDYVPALLARASERAAAERLDATFHEGDAEHLPFPDASFRYVLSTFGVMFAPDQAQAARELVRVCKPGGRIALASWTPEGFVGDLLRAVARYVPPPPFAASALRWGTPSGIAELFPGLQLVAAERRSFVFRYTSPAHFIGVFRDYYGPTHKAFAGLDEARRAQLAADLELLWIKANRSTSGELVVPGEYLEAVLERTPRAS